MSGRTAPGAGSRAGRSAAPARSTAVKRLGAPRPARVRLAADGRPAALDGACVDAVREDWVVEDRWWTDTPLRRRYFELVLADGRNAVVFHDLIRGPWFHQRA